MQQIKQQEQGQALLESYVKENAKDSEALNTLGVMQMKDGNYEDALKYFQMGLKIQCREQTGTDRKSNSRL